MKHTFLFRLMDPRDRDGGGNLDEQGNQDDVASENQEEESTDFTEEDDTESTEDADDAAEDAVDADDEV